MINSLKCFCYRLLCFWLQSKAVSLGGFISLILFFCYKSDNGNHILWFFSGKLAEFIFLIAIGFIVNFIFYIFQTYIPEYYRKKRAMGIILKRIERISSCIIYHISNLK